MQTSRTNSSGRAKAQYKKMSALWKEAEHEPVASEAIYATLRKAILSGVLAPGEPLGEVQLGELFRRSRTPVREAIRRLESERLAQRSTRRGYIVGRLTRENVLDVYAVRGVLDGLAARLAAFGILPGELDHLHWLNDQMRDECGNRNYRKMLILNIDFHEAICRASRNSMLLQFISQIHDWVRRFPSTTFSHPGRAEVAMQEHDALLEALGRRDSEEAERIARLHMSHAMQVRVTMLQAASHDVS